MRFLKILVFTAFCGGTALYAQNAFPRDSVVLRSTDFQEEYFAPTVYSLFNGNYLVYNSMDWSVAVFNRRGKQINRIASKKIMCFPANQCTINGAEKNVYPAKDSLHFISVVIPFKDGFFLASRQDFIIKEFDNKGVFRKEYSVMELFNNNYDIQWGNSHGAYDPERKLLYLPVYEFDLESDDTEGCKSNTICTFSLQSETIDTAFFRFADYYCYGDLPYVYGSVFDFNSIDNRLYAANQISNTLYEYSTDNNHVNLRTHEIEDNKTPRLVYVENINNDKYDINIDHVVKNCHFEALTLASFNQNLFIHSGDIYLIKKLSLVQDTAAFFWDKPVSVLKKSLHEESSAFRPIAFFESKKESSGVHSVSQISKINHRTKKYSYMGYGLAQDDKLVLYRYK